MTHQISQHQQQYPICKGKFSTISMNMPFTFFIAFCIMKMSKNWKKERRHQMRANQQSLSTCINALISTM